jgi:hypothetical protein
MGGASKFLLAVGMFPWSLLTLVFRSFVPAGLSPLLLAASAILFLAGAASTTHSWYRRRNPTPWIAD